MHAAIIEQYGQSDAITIAELPDPEPAPGEVTIDVDLAAIGLVDVLVRRGDFPFPLPLVPGLSVAGRIRALGAGVTNVSRGQPVAAFTAPPRMGGYATVALAPAALAIPLDTAHGTIASDEGAIAIVNGPTAYLALAELGGLQVGDPVVVHGATGALGAMVAQLASYLGASPLIATVGSPAKRAHAESLGYTHVFSSSDDWPTAVRDLTNGHGAALVVDPVGGPLREASLRALRPLGRLIAVGHASEQPDAPVSPTDLWLGNQAILGLNVGALSAVDPERFAAAARAVFELIARRMVRVDVGGVLTLAEAAEAHRRLEARSVTGTLLLRASDGVSP